MKTQFFLLICAISLLFLVAIIAPKAGIASQSRALTPVTSIYLPVSASNVGLASFSAVSFTDTIIWEVQEVTFTAGSVHNWTQFPLQATFVHAASNRRLTVDGYWSGNNDWTIRFAPPLTGIWSWQTDSSDPSLDGQSGQFTVSAPSPAAIANNTNYRGHLKVSVNGRYLEYADQTPFLWLGDTNWNINSLRAGLEVGSQGSPFYTYLADRKAKKFTLLQTQFFEIIDANEGGYPFPNNVNDSGDWSVINPAHFDKLDTRMQAIWNAGFAVAAHPTWLSGAGSANKVTVSNAQNISRYLLARYGAYNLLWSLSGEYQYSYDNGEYSWTPSDWNTLGIFVQAYNAYGHPVTIHPSSQAAWNNFYAGAGEQSSSGEFHQKAWLDFNWHQTGHRPRFLENVPERIQIDYAKSPSKPAIHSESWYENHDRFDPAPTRIQLRWKGWVSFLSGGAGFTYGAVGVWPFYNPDVDSQPPLSWNSLTWLQGIQSTGSNDIQYLYNFFSGIDWWRLEPRRSALKVNGAAAQYDYKNNRQDPHLAAKNDDSLLVVYVPENNQGKTLTTDGLNPGQSFSATWFDPQTGNTIDAGTYSTNGSGILVLPQLPSNNDWALTLTAGATMPTATATSAVTPTATSTETLAEASTETPTATSTEATMGTSTATATPTPTPTFTPTATPTMTSTMTSTSTATATDTPLSNANCGGTVQEAEEATLAGTFVIGNDSNASAGGYIHAPERSRYSITNNPDTATFCVHIEQPGTYRIVGNVYSASGGQNSFFFTIDGQPSGGHLWSMAINTEYDAIYLEPKSQGSPVEAQLSAGKHSLTFYLREKKTRLDRISFELQGGAGNPTATTTATAAPTNSPGGETPTATPSPTQTATSTATPTANSTSSPGSGGAQLTLSLATGGSVNGINAADEDILIHDLDSGSWALYLDGSDIGLSSVNLDAFALLGDGSMIMSVDKPKSLPDVGRIDDSDLVRFVPSSTGATTAGTFEWYFDGSDVGLTTSGEDITAVAVLGDGTLLISVVDRFSVPGASGGDEDLIIFSPTQLGASTSGTWRFYFDGSDVALRSGNEDIHGLWLDEATNDIVMTTKTSFNVSSVQGSGGDLLACAPTNLGSTTACNYRLYWDASTNNLGNQAVDAISIERSSSVQATDVSASAMQPVAVDTQIAIRAPIDGPQEAITQNHDQYDETPPQEKIFLPHITSE